MRTGITTGMNDRIDIAGVGAVNPAGPGGEVSP
jgi:hypothetical protein